MFDCPGVDFDSRSDWQKLKQRRLQVVGHRPLLLLYPIDRTSAPARQSQTRVPLDACRDQVGLGIVFPGSAAGAGGYFHVDLNPPSTEDLDAMDAEINEMEAEGLVS